MNKREISLYVPGTVQLLTKNKEAQKKLIDYLNHDIGIQEMYYRTFVEYRG